MSRSNWLLIPIYDQQGNPRPGQWEFFPGGLLDEDIPVYEYRPFHPLTEADKLDD